MSLGIPTRPFQVFTPNFCTFLLLCVLRALPIPNWQSVPMTETPLIVSAHLSCPTHLRVWQIEKLWWQKEEEEKKKEKKKEKDRNEQRGANCPDMFGNFCCKSCLQGGRFPRGQLQVTPSLETSEEGSFM